MNTKILRVVAAVVDTRQLTLYKEDGTTVVIPQGDARLRKIVEEAAPQLVRQGWADVTISHEADTSFADFEKVGSGAVKFFRVAKSKLKALFNPEPAPPVFVNTSPVPPLSIGPVPMPATPAALPVVQPVTPALVVTTIEHITMMQQEADMISATLGQARQTLVNTMATVAVPNEDEQEEVIQHEPSEPAVKQTMDAINEILAQAVPSSSPDFHSDTVAKQGNIVEMNGGTDNQKNEVRDEPDTIIAVIDGKVVPGMERISSQFRRAAKMGSTVGVETFLRRLASVIEQRSHSVEDLLKFMERADTPIADDGSIIIYKVLRKQSNGKYVDCHTRNVEQFVGAYVCMDPKLVDHNRNNECSNGLHVARRGYLSSFGGDVCVLAKLAPEDVITIPTYDANKMRVCGYHILHELSQEQYDELKCNRPITNTEAGKVLLGKMLAGHHVRRTHEVRITQQKGGGVVTTELKAEAPKPTMADVPAKLISDAADAIEEHGEDELERYRDEQEAKKVKASPPKAEALANPDGQHGASPTNPLDVVKKVEGEQQLSKKEQAQAMYAAWLSAPTIDKAEHLSALVAFKKEAKKGWDVLGIPDPTVNVKGIVKVALAPKPNTTPKLFPEVKEVKPKPAHADAVAKLDRKVVKDGKGLPVSTNTPPMPKVKTPSQVYKVVDATHGDGPPKQRIAKLLAIGLDSAGIAASVLAIKKSAKKSWEILGVSKAQVAEILKQTGKP